MCEGAYKVCVCVCVCVCDRDRGHKRDVMIISLISLLLWSDQRDREKAEIKGCVLLFSHSVASSRRTSLTVHPLSLQPAGVGWGYVTNYYRKTIKYTLKSYRQIHNNTVAPHTDLHANCTCISSVVCSHYGAVFSINFVFNHYLKKAQQLLSLPQWPTDNNACFN